MKPVTYLVGATIALAAGSAQAEAVRMTGRFVAEAREVALQRAIAVERFAGRDGAAYALALERALARDDQRTPPHFAIVAPDRADALVSGAVSTDVDVDDWIRTDKKCVEKDAGGKCVRKEEVRIPCWRRTIDLTVDVRVAGERLLYTAERPKQDETSWCRGEDPYRTTEEAIRAMIAQSATETAQAFAPQVVNYSVRFRESTKGLPKPVARAFKAAVRQSQVDLAGACTAWGAIDAQAPNHPSVVFDLGLCAEAVGDHAQAADLYRRAVPLLGSGDEAKEGLDRIARMVAAREDDARR